eukprot:TRINITY_DN24478_c0_g1_i1.p1 TRINITY_DN24478_c0_g1~~TRINITY_DN24478_c0_g1_i1.p1  ORF type:complete len:198 (-),score=6.54 TRINITY_DN24478_c0_g1_i1:167-760(-)
MTTHLAMNALFTLSFISCYRLRDNSDLSDISRCESHNLRRKKQTDQYVGFGGQYTRQTDTTSTWLVSNDAEAAVMLPDTRICKQRSDGLWCLCPALPLTQTTKLYWSTRCLPQLKFIWKGPNLYFDTDAYPTKFSGYFEAGTAKFTLNVVSGALVLWDMRMGCGPLDDSCPLTRGGCDGQDMDCFEQWELVCAPPTR